MVTDPRVLRSRAKVLTAAADLIVERGLSGVAVEHVTARSGVAKTTIYRQWPTLAPLLFDAVTEALPPPPEAPADVVTYLCALADSLDARSVALVGALGVAARTDPALAELNREFVRQRREPLRAMLVAAGHRDVETLLAALGGAIFYWRLVASEPVERTAVEALVRRVLG
jgi:AcrR family transcriptional regulator